MTILVIHGPNLNLLGTREPEVYGKKTLKEIDAMIVAHAKKLGVDVRSTQTNHEGVIIDLIQTAAGDGIDAIVLNPGAYTHTSVAIADAIRSVKTPVIEVHLTNLWARGGDRARSITAAACRGVVMGFGAESYLQAIDSAAGVAKATTQTKAGRKRPLARRSARRK